MEKIVIDIWQFIKYYIIYIYNLSTVYKLILNFLNLILKIYGFINISSTLIKKNIWKYL